MYQPRPRVYSNTISCVLLVKCLGQAQVIKLEQGATSNEKSINISNTDKMLSPHMVVFVEAELVVSRVDDDFISVYLLETSRIFVRKFLPTIT